MYLYLIIVTLLRQERRGVSDNRGEPDASLPRRRDARCRCPTWTRRRPPREERIASSAKWTAGPSTRAEDACQYEVGTSRQRIAVEAASRPDGQEWRCASGTSTGGASYPAPLSLDAVVVPTAGRAAKPPVPLSAAPIPHSCPRSSRTAGQENGGKGVGPACRGRRGKGGGEWTRMRPRAETAPCPQCRP